MPAPKTPSIPPDSLLKTWRTIDQAVVQHLSRKGMPFSIAASLIHLYIHPELTEPAQLADAIFIPRQSMTFTLDALERDGLALRQSHPNDRRKKIIALTPKGRRRAKDVLDDLLHFESQAFAAFTQEEFQTLRTLLTKLMTAITLLENQGDAR
jgi:DNA-binding MarR family transcriptional regulator